MQKVEAFAQAAGLLGAQLRRGVVTNSFLTAADCDREAKTGLYVYEADGELLVFRDRGTHYILNFFLQQGARPTLPDVSKPVVTELAYRPKDADAMLSAAAYFREIGFEEVLRRTRRTRSGASAGVQRASQQAVSASRSGVSAGAAAGEAAVMDFLKQEFSQAVFSRRTLCAKPSPQDRFYVPKMSVASVACCTLRRAVPHPNSGISPSARTAAGRALQTHSLTPTCP